MAPVLLVYNLRGERAAKVSMLAMIHSIRVRAVRPEEYGQSLGALCGLPDAAPPAEADPFDEEMLVMAFFTDELANRFLQALRRSLTPSVRLKAMLTDTNRSWSSPTLRGELLREAEAFEKMRAAKKAK